MGAVQWQNYMAPLVGYAEGSAIINFNGTECANLGNWTTNSTHESLWAYYLQNLSQAVFLVYNNTNFVVVSTANNTIHATCGSEGLLLKRATTVFVAARYVPPILPAALSPALDVVVNNLIAAGK
jgi:hypothetical protein